MNAEDARYNAAAALVQALSEAGLVSLELVAGSTTEGLRDYARSLLSDLVDDVAGVLENEALSFDDASGTGE